jgi:hypothetical protein
MVCTFYNSGFKDCTMPYCYYPKSSEIDCPVKKEHLDKVGVIWPESTGPQPGAPGYPRYPKRYGCRED